MRALQRARGLVLTVLKQGMTPERVAVCVAAGVAISVFPIIGVPTLLATVVALRFRLNLPLIQAVNYVAAPLQWLCIVPFLRLGERVYGATPLPLSPREIVAALQADGWAFIAEFTGALWHAATGWLLVVPALFAVVVWVARGAVRRLAARPRVAGEGAPS